MSRTVRLLAVASLVAGGAAWVADTAAAIDVPGYTTAANDRFASGFPAAPVANVSPGFVGLGYDWSGVGWAATDPTKGFGLLSPRHYLVASHYGGAATIRLQAADGALVSGTQQSVTNTGFGLSLAGTPDLSLGRFTTAVPQATGIARYAVLDLNGSSTTDSPANYANRPVLLSGRNPTGSGSPVVASSSVFSASSTLYGSPNNGVMITKTTSGTLQTGDSGSPAFLTWTNPDGGQELTIIGNNAAVDTAGGNNVQNFVGRAAIMGELNTLMNPDGFALRVVGNASNTWVGVSSTSLGNRSAWGVSRPLNAPSDVFVLFDGTTAGSGRVVTVDSDRSLRGLSFRSTSSGTLGFSFGGSSTLTVGRGGITNYDASQQVFTAPLALGASQYWDVGSGGVTVGGIDTAGHLLEIAGGGTARITGPVSGGGGLALSGLRLELAGANGYTGGTWVHAGTLALVEDLVGGGIGSIGGTPSIMVAAGATFDVAAAALIPGSAGFSLAAGQTLGGEGTVAGSVVFGAGSTLSPGGFGPAAAAGATGSGVTLTAVPEPSTTWLAATGLVAMAMAGCVRCFHRIGGFRSDGLRS